ncbi:MAG: cytidine deaminase, partial [Polyangiaceae bacterium]
CQMIAAGEREPVACAVATGGPRAGSPCGICRQVLREFARDMPIALVAEKSGRLTRRDTTLAKLLPDAFDGSILRKRKPR